MQTLESIGQTRSLIKRSLLYFHFGRRLLRKVIQLSGKAGRLQKRLDSIQDRHETHVQMLESQANREISRLEELVESYRLKVEITQRETVDRLLESQKMIGISYATRETDDRIQTLRYQPHEEARAAEMAKKGLYYTLAPEHQQTYDSEYDSHVRLGRSQGFDDATIERTWKQFEEQIVEGIQG